MKHLLVLLSVGLLGFALAGCGGKDKYKPKALPLTTALDRTSHKIEKVDLVIKDRARAAKVKSIYEDIESTLLARQLLEGELRAKGFNATAKSGGQSSEGIRAIFAALRPGRASLFDQYFALQLELRKHLTEDEFKRLDSVR